MINFLVAPMGGFQAGDKRPMTEGVEANLPKKKKYAKEAWPGRKPGPAQGLF